MLTNQQCGFCKGSGRAQQLQERRDGGIWHLNTMLPHDVADSWIAADRYAPLRWVDTACPRCDGAGSETIEHVTCKIY